MEPYQVLTKARNIIAKPGGWTQGWFARDAKGERTDIEGDEAVSFCAMGALYRAHHESKVRNFDLAPSVRFLMAVVDKNKHLEGGGVVQFNDSANSADEVVAVFDKAIALASERKYWIYKHITYCPQCGKSDVAHERRPLPKPENPADRRHEVEQYDYCDAL